LLDTLILPPEYPIIGSVTIGLAVVDRLSRFRATLQSDAQETSLPLTPIRILSLSVARLSQG